MDVQRQRANFKLYSNMQYGIVQPGSPYALGWAKELPGFRVEFAKQRGRGNEMLLKLWGGIGDQICAEPTLRWATTGGLKGSRITLATQFPELFSHLKFDEIFDLKYEKPIEDDYNVFETIAENDALTWQFVSHMITHCVNYCQICAFRGELYSWEKNVILKPPEPNEHTEIARLAREKRQFILVHAGRHWQSKTFPKTFWNACLDSIKRQGFTPILIGKDDKEKDPGVVDVDDSGCVNLVDKTTLMESVWLAQRMPVVFCNDSSVLHMAVTGNAWIGCLATAKHPEYIFHWRNVKGENQWRWRQQQLALGGMWDLVDNVPDGSKEKKCDLVSTKYLDEWLPDPETIGPWCKEKSDDYFRTTEG